MPARIGIAGIGATAAATTGLVAYAGTAHSAATLRDQQAEGTVPRTAGLGLAVAMMAGAGIMFAGLHPALPWAATAAMTGAGAGMLTGIAAASIEDSLVGASRQRAGS